MVSFQIDFFWIYFKQTNMIYDLNQWLWFLSVSYISTLSRFWDWCSTVTVHLINNLLKIKFFYITFWLKNKLRNFLNRFTSEKTPRNKFITKMKKLQKSCHSFTLVVTSDDTWRAISWTKGGWQGFGGIPVQTRPDAK